MEKFECACGKKVRDVYYKNGDFTCVKCFWQDNQNQFDYIINMLAARGLAITYQNQPVLVMKQFSADFLEQAGELIRPNETWVIIDGDDYWSHYNGNVMNLRAYITDYGKKKDKDNDNSKPPAQAAPASSNCSSCSGCSQGHEED